MTHYHDEQLKRRIVSWYSGSPNETIAEMSREEIEQRHSAICKKFKRVVANEVTRELILIAKPAKAEIIVERLVRVLGGEAVDAIAKGENITANAVKVSIQDALARLAHIDTI